MCVCVKRSKNSALTITCCSLEIRWPSALSCLATTSAHPSLSCSLSSLFYDGDDDDNYNDGDYDDSNDDDDGDDGDDDDVEDDNDNIEYDYTAAIDKADGF